MNNTKCCMADFCRVISLVGLGLAAWKIIMHVHKGEAKQAGHSIDATINAAAEKLEKTASALEELSQKGLAKNLGKGFDAVLQDTKKTLEHATDIVQRALKHAQ